MCKLLQKSNDATGDSATSVASGPGVRMAGPAEVVAPLVEDEAPADDAVGPPQGQLAVHEIDVADAFLVELHVTEVTHVTDWVVGVAVGHLKFIEM